MPTKPTDDTDALIDRAETACRIASDTRRLHRRRTKKGSPQREADLKIASDHLRDAMRPIRRELARFPYRSPNQTAHARRLALLGASEAVQRERRKVWKMRRR
jgi:hypothetical protein